MCSLVKEFPMRRHFVVLLAAMALSTGFACAQEKTEPPPKPPVQRVRQSGDITRKNVIKSVPPIYPAEARAKGIQGKVKLHAIIGKDGSVSQLEVISGKPILSKAAMDAVRQWRYRPTLLNGEAVEVDTTIDVNFILN
jgi:protein TonB